MELKQVKLPLWVFIERIMLYLAPFCEYFVQSCWAVSGRRLWKFSSQIRYHRTNGLRFKWNCWNHFFQRQLTGISSSYIFFNIVPFIGVVLCRYVSLFCGFIGWKWRTNHNSSEKFYCVLTSGFTGKCGICANKWVWISVTKMESVEIEAMNRQMKKQTFRKESVELSCYCCFSVLIHDRISQ